MTRDECKSLHTTCYELHDSSQRWHVRAGTQCGDAANHLVVSIALIHVVQLPAVAKVEQELLDWAACIHLGIYPSIDAVKDPGYPNQQGGFHLSCKRQTGISESVLKQESPTNSILERV
jgi:hypothetical protein